MKACVYLLNNNPNYIKMACHSISMLRQHNDAIKVICLCLDNFDLPEELNVEKIKVDNLDNFFFSNKQHLGHLDYESILYIDSDTFIFGDVEKVFDYDADFVGCENSWCYGQGFDLFKPTNGGLLLFKNGSNKEIYKDFNYKLKNMNFDYPKLNEWIIKTNNEWTREEFLTSQIVEDLKINRCFFNKSHCHTLMWKQDFETMKESIIFHTFTNQWKTGLFYSQKQKPKIFPHLSLHRYKKSV